MRVRHCCLSNRISCRVICRDVKLQYKAPKSPNSHTYEKMSKLTLESLLFETIAEVLHSFSFYEDLYKIIASSACRLLQTFQYLFTSGFDFHCEKHSRRLLERGHYSLGLFVVPLWATATDKHKYILRRADNQRIFDNCSATFVALWPPKNPRGWFSTGNGVLVLRHPWCCVILRSVYPLKLPNFSINMHATASAGKFCHTTNLILHSLEYCTNTMLITYCFLVLCTVWFFGN